MKWKLLIKAVFILFIWVNIVMIILLEEGIMEKGFILSLILAAIVGVFALSNGERVEIDLIFTEVFMSQAIVIFISTFLGAVIVAILGWMKSWKYKRQIKDLNKKIISADAEKNNLTEILKNKEEQIKTLYNRNTEILSKEE